MNSVVSISETTNIRYVSCIISKSNLSWRSQRLPAIQEKCNTVYADDSKNIAFFTFSCSLVFCTLFLHVIGENLNAIYRVKIFRMQHCCSSSVPLSMQFLTPKILQLCQQGFVCTQLYFCFKKFSLLLFTKPFALQHIYCMTYIVFASANYHLNHTVNFKIKYKNPYWTYNTVPQKWVFDYGSECFYKRFNFS